MNNFVPDMDNWKQMGMPTMAPPTGAPTMVPPMGAPTMAPPTGAPTMAPPMGAPTMAPPTGAPTMAPPTGTPTMAPSPEGNPSFIPQGEIPSMKKAVPEALEIIAEIPAPPALTLVKTEKGYAWMIGNDNSLVWDGSSFVKC